MAPICRIDLSGPLSLLTPETQLLRALPNESRAMLSLRLKSVTVQNVQNNRPQTRALHALSLHSQLLSEANGRSAHSEIKIHPIANKFA